MTDTERLRRLDKENEELRNMINQVAWRLGLGDEVYYYRGDNFLACHLRVFDAINGLIERESDVETVRSDAMDAWRWVRDHGGLSHVKEHWSGRVAQSHVHNMAERHKAKIARMQSHIEFVQGKCRERQERIVELNKTIAAMRPRLMPEGVEWPRYESGEPVRIGDAIADELGHGHEVSSVEVFDDAVALHWNPSEPEEFVWLVHGERARRPAVLAGDGEPLEAGKTVWHEDGTELRVVGFKHAEDGETIVRVEYVDGPTDWSEVRSLSLTHTKPEQKSARGSDCEPSLPFTERLPAETAGSVWRRMRRTSMICHATTTQRTSFAAPRR